MKAAQNSPPLIEIASVPHQSNKKEAVLQERTSDEYEDDGFEMTKPAKKEA